MQKLKPKSASNSLFSEPKKPMRPSLPLAFFLFSCIFVSAKASFLSQSPEVVGCVLAGLGAIAAGTLFALKKREQFKVVALLLIVGFAAVSVSAIALFGLSAGKVCLSNNPVSAFTYSVLQDSTESQYGYSTKADAIYEGKRVATVWLKGNDAYSTSDVLSLVGRFEAMDDSDYGVSNYLQGVVGTVAVSKTTSCERDFDALAPINELRSHILETLPNTEGFALIKGVLLGSKDALKALDLDTVFSAAGIAHMVAVSGAHLAIVSVFIEMLCARANVSRKTRCALLLGITFGYVALCRFPVSAIRAWCMNSACFGAAIVMRRNSAITAVSAVGACAILVCPLLVSNLGFLLSITCVLSLCLFGPLVNYYMQLLLPTAWIGKIPYAFRKCAYKTVEAAQQIVGCSLVCGLAAAPLTAATFSQVSLVGPLSNLCITPLFAPLMAVGACSILLGWIPLVGPLLLNIAGAFGSFVIMLARAFATIPGAVYPVEISQDMAVALVCGAFALILVAWPLVARKTLYALLGGALTVFLCVSFVIPALIGPTRAVVLDVGQGDSILLQDKNHAFLVDTGPDNSALMRLKELGIFSLDGVLITHQHDDHYGGLKYFLGAFAFKQVFVAEGVQNNFCSEIAKDVSDMNLDVTTLSAGDTFSVGAWHIDVVWPKTQVDGTENAHSICCLATLDLPPPKSEFTMLLTGDAEKDEMAGYVDQIKTLDVLKVGHHGSAVSISKEEAERIKPTVAIASAGKNNRYGHPKQACVDTLEGAGADFYCTKDVGSVDIRPHAQGFNVICQKSGEVLAYD